MSTVLRWLIAINPITLTSGASSVVIGALVAYNLGAQIDVVRLAATLAGIAMLQASANLVDDYFDYKAGLDQPGSTRRKHPILDLGIEPRSVVRVAAALSLAAAIVGLWLSLTSPAPMIALTLMSIGAFTVWQYSAPPLKLRHRGLGELVSAANMGPLIAMGSYTVLGGPTWGLWLPAIASLPNASMTLLALAAADLEHLERDRAYGKATIATIFGEKAAVRLAKASVAMYAAGIIAGPISGALPTTTLMALVATIIPMRALRVMESGNIGRAWKDAFLGRTAYVAFSILATAVKHF